MSLIHLSTLIADRNGVREEEWSNFEFYLDPAEYPLNPFQIHSLSKNGTIRPFKFTYKLEDILTFLFGDSGHQNVVSLKLVYRKRTLPQLMN